MDIPEGYELVSNSPQANSDIPEGYELVPPKQSGFVDNASNALSNRWQNMQDIGNQALAGQSSFPKTALRMAGQETGALNDVIGAGISSAYNNLTTQDMRNNASENINKLANTSLGQMASNAIKSGVGAWNQYASQNPDTAQNIRDVANISTGVLGAKGLTDLVGSAANNLSGLSENTWNGAMNNTAPALSKLGSNDISGNPVTNFFAKTPNPLKVGMELHDNLNQTFDAAKNELTQTSKAARAIAPEVDATPILDKLNKITESLSNKTSYGDGEENALSTLNDIKTNLANKVPTTLSTAGEAVSKPKISASDLMDVESSINDAIPKGQATPGSRHLIDVKNTVQGVLSDAGKDNPDFGAAYGDYKNKAISLAKNFSDNPTLKGVWQPKDYLSWKAYQNSLAKAREANPILQNMPDEEIAKQINATLPPDQQISPYSPAALSRIGNSVKNLGKGDLGTISSLNKLLPGESNDLLRQALLVNKENNVSLGSALLKLKSGNVPGALQTAGGSLMTGGRKTPLESALKNLQDLKK